MIPSTIRREWEDLVNGEFNPKLTSLSLQLKLNALRLDLKIKKMDVKIAAAELYDFCVKNEKMIQKDLSAIFSSAYIIS